MVVAESPSQSAAAIVLSATDTSASTNTKLGVGRVKSRLVRLMWAVKSAEGSLGPDSSPQPVRCVKM